MDCNEWADFWRYKIGVNVIPADSIIKKTWVKWSKDPRGNWQVDPIPQSIHDAWKNTNAFDKGMAVICGKVHHNQEKSGLYLCAIDADNKKGCDVLHSKGLDYLKEKTLVEQHTNCPEKAHVYFYTHKPTDKKSSDAVNLDLLSKMNTNEIPALEMKGDGTHGIMYCTPSPHRDGSNYQIMGIDEPAILDEIGDVINRICDEYSLGRTNKNRISNKLLVEDDTRIIEGSNRHEAIMVYAEVLLRKLFNGKIKLEDNIFRDIIMAKNNRMCIPPLNETEIDVQIKCATEFIAEKIEEEQQLKKIEKNKYGTPEFWTMVRDYRDTFNPVGNFIKCMQCRVEIDANPLDNTHRDHNVVLK